MMTLKQAVKYQPRVYENDELLKKAYEHLVVKKCSVWTFAYPTKGAYDNRCKADEVFAEQFKCIRMMSEQNLELILWDNMDNKDFNDKLFNMACKNKKSFQSYEVIELEGRLETLEAKDK